ncbi:MAG TPA: hypothetical protein VHT03_13760 [Rhizomicrobium sp.]|jgi:cytochrome c5|nr:hypothetical protein [Rhizomicrobium sp.]
MRVFAALLFSSAVVLVPALAAAQATTAPAAPTAPAATTDTSGVNLDEIVCRNSPPTTGSRLGGGRECHSVREWNDRERQAQDLTREQQRVGFNAQGAGGGH